MIHGVFFFAGRPNLVDSEAASAKTDDLDNKWRHQ